MSGRNYLCGQITTCCVTPFDSYYNEETKEDKIVRIAKYDFERFFGMTFSDFSNQYNTLLENNPEKFI